MLIRIVSSKTEKQWSLSRLQCFDKVENSAVPSSLHNLMNFFTSAAVIFFHLGSFSTITIIFGLFICSLALWLVSSTARSTIPSGKSRLKNLIGLLHYAELFLFQDFQKMLLLVDRHFQFPIICRPFFIFMTSITSVPIIRLKITMSINNLSRMSTFLKYLNRIKVFISFRIVT